jgi:hypothetical protein
MHPEVMSQLAAAHGADMRRQAALARRARQARRARRGGPALASAGCRPQSSTGLIMTHA